MSALLKHIDFSKPSLLYSLASIAFNPTAWNIVARNGERSSQPPVGEGESSNLYTVIPGYRCSIFDD